MKRVKIDLSEEKRLLANMITNTSFLRGIRDIYQPTLFETSFAKTISAWVWEYYNRTAACPGRDIQDIYFRRRSEVQDEDDVELIADYLTALNSNYQELEINNVLYEVQKAEAYFKLRSLEKLSERINQAVTGKDYAKGEQLVSEYKRVEKPTGSGIDLFSDASAIQEAFNFHEERLFKFPGVLGEQLGYFCRGDFLAILAGVKSGKTFYLFEFAKYAALFGFNAIFYSLEMTQAQMLRRSWKSLVGQPIEGGTHYLPTFADEGGGKFSISKRIMKYESLDLEQVEKKQMAYRNQSGGSLRMDIFPSGSGTMQAIESNLANLEYYDDFIPDVIVIDYADIIKADSRGEYRHRLNDIWLKLRGWAQDKNCLVVTASQINKSAFTRDIKKGDVSEDSRKLAHVTQLYALNQTTEEQTAGVHRIEPLLSREGRLSTKQICVLENRDIGRIYLDSQLVENVIDYKNGKLKVEDENFD